LVNLNNKLEKPDFEWFLSDPLLKESLCTRDVIFSGIFNPKSGFLFEGSFILCAFLFGYSASTFDIDGVSISGAPSFDCSIVIDGVPISGVPSSDRSIVIENAPLLSCSQNHTPSNDNMSAELPTNYVPYIPEMPKETLPKIESPLITIEQSKDGTPEIVTPSMIHF
jgi:hypothetical protein